MSNPKNGYNNYPPTNNIPMDAINNGAMPISVQPGVYFVPSSGPMPGVPTGLEYLTQLDQVIIQQKIELWELLTDFETQNKYVLRNANGDQAYYAYEESSCCMRCWCNNQRKFKLHIIDNFKREVLLVDRPFKCCGNCCCGLCASTDSCAQECEISTPQGVLAHARQLYNGCSAKYELRGANEEFLFIVTGPCCCAFCGCQDKEFEIHTTDGNHIGSITKKWRGCCAESFTDSDVFAVTFPMDLNVKAKASLVGLTFLIDFMYFEEMHNNNKHG